MNAEMRRLLRLAVNQRKRAVLAAPPDVKPWFDDPFFCGPSKAEWRAQQKYARHLDAHRLRKDAA